MSPKRAAIAVVAACAVVCAAPASAGSTGATQISIGDNFFKPATATRTVGPGPSFHWSRVSGSIAPHNVLQDSQLFSSGSPTSKAIDFSVSASAGSYHYFCVVHAGMEGTVKVRPSVDETPAGLPFRVTWAVTGTTTGNKFDVRYKVGSGPWQAWRNQTTGRSAVFGHGGTPVAVKAGQTYRFEARSGKSPQARSDWSPPVTVRP